MPSDFDPDTPRDGLAKVIPRRPRVTWTLAIVFALVFAALVTPAITAERWLSSIGVGGVVEGQVAPLTVRVPVFAGVETADARVRGGGIVIARGQLANEADEMLATSIAAATPGGALPYAAFAVLTLVLAAIFAHHMRRSTRGRLVRVQLVSLIGIALLAVATKIVLLGSAVSVLVVPVALLAIVPTMVLDRVVGLATGVLAALVVTLLGPFDLGVAILMLVQAATAGLVVAERPKQRWRAAVGAGLVTTLFTVATYVLLVYLTTGTMPSFADPLRSPWLAAAVGPAIAMLVAVPLIPLYQLLVGEITQGKLVELEDLSNPLLRQIAERSPGTWQHSLMMANMAEIAANAIGANGRLVRVGAYYHDLGKSLQPKYFIENLEPGEVSPHDRLPPEVSCDAIFSHVTEGIVTARKAGLHERIVDFMHMHHGDGVLEYFWGRCREQGNPHGLSIERFRYPGHPPQSRETAILAICDAVEAASRTLKKPEPASIDSLVQRIVYGKLHLGQLDESGLSMSDLRRVSDSLRETIRHANHGRIEYPWQKAEQDASASQQTTKPQGQGTEPRLDSLDRKPNRQTGVSIAVAEDHSPAASIPIELGEGNRKRASQEVLDTAKREALAIAETANLGSTAMPRAEPPSASHQGEWQQLSESKIAHIAGEPGAAPDGMIGPSTFAQPPATRAATLSPPPPRRAPTVPPPAGSTLTGQRPASSSQPPPTQRPASSSSPPAQASQRPTSSSSHPPASSPPHRPSQPPSPSQWSQSHPPPSAGLRAPGDTSPATLPGAGPIATGTHPRTGTPESSAVLPRAAFDSSFAVPRAAHDSSRPLSEVAKSTLTGVPSSGIPEPRAGRDSSAPVIASAPRPPPMAPATTLPNPFATREPAKLEEAPGMTTLQGRPAPKHLPASGSGSMPRGTPSTDTRLGGPPPKTDLENAITNPPPMRRPPATRLPGAILPEDDPSSTAPRLPATPITAVGHVSGQFGLPEDDAGRTDPSLPTFAHALPLRAPPTDPPRTSLAERVDAALEDEWGTETPIRPPTREQLRSLLGAPDPTRKQSYEELERLHRAVVEDASASEPELFSTRRPASSTAEVDPDDIESAIEIAPPARRAPSSVAVAKPKKPE